MTLRQKVEAYERILHRIQAYREVSMDAKSLSELLDRICSWSYSHRIGNGVLSKRMQDELIKQAFDRLMEFK